MLENAKPYYKRIAQFQTDAFSNQKLAVIVEGEQIGTIEYKNGNIESINKDGGTYTVKDINLALRFLERSYRKTISKNIRKAEVGQQSTLLL